MAEPDDTALDAPTPPSERAFGFTVGGVLAAIGLVRLGLRAWDAWPPMWDAVSLSLLGVGFGLIVLGAIAPACLRVPNRLWFKFGLLLARIVNPVVLFVFYAVCIVPIGVAMRLFGYDPLRLKPDAEASSHWQPHEPSPLDEPMRQQF